LSGRDEKDVPLYQVSPTISKMLSPFLRFDDGYVIKEAGVIKSDSTMLVKAHDSTFLDEDKHNTVMIIL